MRYAYGEMTLWWHYYYLLRGADDDMRKEDCIFSESRLLLGPVVEISNLIFFDNLLKNFITKGWRSPHMSEQGKTICHWRKFRRKNRTGFVVFFFDEKIPLKVVCQWNSRVGLYKKCFQQRDCKEELRENLHRSTHSKW